MVECRSARRFRAGQRAPLGRTHGRGGDRQPRGRAHSCAHLGERAAASAAYRSPAARLLTPAGVIASAPMPATVSVNMLTVVHKSSDGVTIAFPDVCKTPAPP